MPQSSFQPPSQTNHYALNEEYKKYLTKEAFVMLMIISVMKACYSVSSCIWSQANKKAKLLNCLWSIQNTNLEDHISLHLKSA